MAAPLNPAGDLAVEVPTVGKVLRKLDSMDPPKGVKGPEVEGQWRKHHLGSGVTLLTQPSQPFMLDECNAAGASLAGLQGLPTIVY
jgi:hypothetical protein